MMEQKSPIIRVDHIAIVSKQEKKIRKLFNEIGLILSWSGLVPEISVNCDYFKLSNIEFEIVTPTDDDSAVIRHYNTNVNAPLHHIAFEVTSLKEGVDFFMAKGYHPIDGRIFRAPKEDHKVIFLSPFQTGGLLVELVSNNE
jgi:methylmalonyl-CoA epimerase